MSERYLGMYRQLMGYRDINFNPFGLEVGDHIKNANHTLRVLKDGYILVTDEPDSWVPNNIAANKNWKKEENLVPISKDSLIELGFYDDSYSNFSLCIGEPMISVSFRDYSCKELSTVEISDTIIKDIKYMHQIENLINALRGE